MNKKIRSTRKSWARLRIAWIAFGCIGLSILLGCSSTSVPGAPAEPERAGVSGPLRELSVGRLVGTTGRYGGFVWRGIPYAEPPIGERRFRAPIPASGWKGTRDATRFGSACPQYASETNTEEAFSKGDVVGNEDCLFLNVYAPKQARPSKDSTGTRLPVMFWIHGGGNTSGTSSFYNGSRLADEHQVIVVTINYRLGFLGWFRHRSLRLEADPLDASGNFGTLDQILALDWVQKNIDAFGGDPGNVTIFGESAGAWNVISLLASPLAAGKFHRAIAQSPLTWSFSATESENYVDDVLPGRQSSSSEAILRMMLAEGLAEDRASAKAKMAAMDEAALARFLREMSVVKLFAGYKLEGSEAEDGYTCPRLFEDGVVLPSVRLGHAFRPDRAFNRVPVILGTNKDEEKLFLLYDAEYTSQVFGVIPTFRDRDRYLRDAATITRIWRMMGVDDVAEDLSRAMPGDVFSYRFDWDEEPSFLWSNLGELIGAAHGFEIPFVFGHWDLGPNSHRLFNEGNRSGREVLSTAMRSYWAEFAWQGRPGMGRAGQLPRWSAWKHGSSRFAVLDTPADGGVRMSEGRDTTDAIVSTILADASYQSLRRRCTALASIYNWAPLAFSVDDFREAGGGICRSFAIQDLVEPL